MAKGSDGKRMRIIGITLVVISTVSVAWAEVELLNLEKSIEIALANNYGLRAASKNVISAKEGVCEAKTAFYPTLRLESKYIRLNEPPTIDFMGQSIAMGDEVIYDAKGTLQQLLFTGGKISSAYKLAIHNHEAAKLEFIKVKNELILAVKSAYFGILKAQKFYKVATESVNQVDAHLKMAQNYYNVGMVAKIDVLKADVQLANVKQNLVHAENGVKLAKASFNNLLGREQNTPVEVVDILEFTPLELELDKCINTAHLQRPELKQIDVNLKALEQRIKIAKSQYYPSISMIGNYDYQKGHKPKIEWEKTWSVGVMVNLELWNWGATGARVNQAKANLEALEEQKLLLKNRISLEVREAYLNLQEAEKNIGVAKKSIGQAEENFRITKEMYKEGAATSTDVLDAQTLLTQAKTNYYQALYDYNLALARLEKAIGGKL